MSAPNKSNGKTPPVGAGGGAAGVGDKNKKWQMELLMERLRTKSAQHKSFQELSKSTRMTLLEKRYALDAVEKSNLQKCLDSMQHCIKVTTKQGLVERLESLTRQLGLKFMYMEDTSSLFISSDMFYLEIVLDANGSVLDVKVHHECKVELQSCSELVECLSKGDFADFTTQLEGLSSIYQLNAEPKIKSKAFVALQALEADLYDLYQINGFYQEQPVALLLQSPTGIVQRRRGGHAMKLTYFVPPSELLDLEAKTMHAISADLVHAKGLGMSVTVNLEASVAHKLQVQPILARTETQNVAYAPLTAYNSTMLPASFVLTLSKPMPICYALMQQMIRLTELNFGSDYGKMAPIMSLIGRHVSGGEIQNSTKGLFVTLPDQTHCYFMTDNQQLCGEVIKSVPFTEPMHVPQIIQLLRQQALFNTLISSCVRLNSRHDLEAMTMLEVTALSCQHISVSLEHPFEETMVTVEFNLVNIAAIDCNIFSTNAASDQQLASKLSRIVQHCMSIPITIRALIRTWEQQRYTMQQQQMRLGSMGGGGIGDLSGLSRGGDGDGPMHSNGGTSNGGGGGGGIGSSNNPGGNLGSNNSSINSGIKGILLDRNSNGGSAMLVQSLSPAGGGGAGGGGGGVHAPLYDNNNYSYDPLTESRIKKRRVTGEDFWRSPKRNNNNKSDLDQLSAAATPCSSNEDSNSLGGGTQSQQKYNVESKPTKWDVEDFNDANMEKVKSVRIIEALLNENDDDDDDDEDDDDDDDKEDDEVGFNTNEYEEEDQDEDMDIEDENNDSSQGKADAKKTERFLENGARSQSREEVADEDSTSKDPLLAEDDDIGNILNEMKNNQDFNDLVFKVSSPAIKTVSSKQKTDGRQVGVEELLPKMATPFVSITPIVPTTSHRTTSQMTLMTSSSSSLPSSTSCTATTSSALPPLSSSSLGSGSKHKTSAELNLKSVLSDMGITEKRLGLVEIIPLPSVPPPTIVPPSASVTITPISHNNPSSSSASAANKSSSREKFVKKSSSSTSLNSEGGAERAKKRRRREEFAMGPPDKMMALMAGAKLPAENAPAVKPIKLDSNSSSSSSSSSMSPKYATSPKPTIYSPSSSHSGAKMSPRQSPVHYSSPKHSSSSSPKGSPYASVSPKHGATSSGSGKPSMSALKSAASSPKSSDKPSSKGSSDRSVLKDRDKKSSRSGSPKIKPKLKQIDLNAMLLAQEELSQDGNRMGNSSKTKKSSLSAVIDKLKSAQNSPEEILALSKQLKMAAASSASSAPAGSSSSSSKGEKSATGNGAGPSSYIIKHSSDGMKLTFNKTRYKSESSKSSNSSSGGGGSSSGSSSSAANQKAHTGLKPGVSSGPASKKSSSPSSSATSSSSSSSSKSKLPFQKSSSSGNLTSQLSLGSSHKPSSLTRVSSGNDLSKASTSNATESSKKDKKRLESRNSSPHDVLKMLGFASGPQSKEGFVKTLDKKFQIPKLSARSTSVDESLRKESGSAKGMPSSSTVSNPLPSQASPIITGGPSNASATHSSSFAETKSLPDVFISKDVATVTPVKYPLQLSANANFNASGHSKGASVSSNAVQMITTAEELARVAAIAVEESARASAITKVQQQSVSGSGQPLNRHGLATTAAANLGTQQSDKLDYSTVKNTTITMRPPPPIGIHANAGDSKDHVTKQQSSASASLELALDFSNKQKETTIKRTSSPPTFASNRANSPHCSSILPSGISMHIVKSPVPASPLAVIPSPHSNSPACIDDDLMDEAVGITGK